MCVEFRERQENHQSTLTLPLPQHTHTHTSTKYFLREKKRIRVKRIGEVN